MFSRLFVNMLRQGFAAALFFLFTWLATHHLGEREYADYFIQWSAAQIVAAAASLGGYNLIIRAFVLRTSLAQIRRNALTLLALQMLMVAGLAWLAQAAFGVDACVVGLIAVAVLVASQASAVCLGLDRFDVFSGTEIGHSVLLIVCMLLALPDAGIEVAMCLLVASIVKMLAIAWWCRQDLKRYAGSVVLPKQGDRQWAHTFGAYAHGLVQAVYVRGLPGVMSGLMGATAFATLAPTWALVDKCIAIIQGANQMLYPKLLSGALSVGKARWINAVLLLMFVLISLGVVWTWGVSRHRLVSAGLPLVMLASTLMLIFVPLAYWLLQSSNMLAMGRYRLLFGGHAINAGVILWCLPMLAERGEQSWVVALALSGASIAVTAAVLDVLKVRNRSCNGSIGDPGDAGRTP